MVDPSFSVRISREVDLVQTLLDTRRGGERLRVLELLQSEIDVDHLLRYLASHRLLPLFHRQLLDEFPEDIPSSLANPLHQATQQRTRFNLAATSELLKIVRLLNDNGINHLPWKGPVLSMRLYGDVALRPFGDLDIVISPEDVIRTDRLLRSIGYEPVVAVATHQESAFVKYEHDRVYLQRENGLHLEVHWRFFDRYIAFKLEESVQWERMSSLQIGGEAVRLMNPEVELLILSLHGAKHVWRSAGWLLDIHSLLLKEPIDWERLVAVARQTGTVRVLLLALELAHHYFGTSRPDTIQKLIDNDPVVAELVMDVCSGPLYKTRDEIAVEDDPHFYLRSRERRRDRWHYRWYWLFTPNIKDQDFLRLPAWLSPLHYLIRPLRLVAAWVRRPW